MLEGRRIVLVEDDEIMGASLVQRLELEGAEVQWHRQILRARKLEGSVRVCEGASRIKSGN